MNKRVIIYVVGAVLLIESALMLLPLLVAIIYRERTGFFFLWTLLGTAAVGAAATLIVELFPYALIGIFGAANESVYYTQFAVLSFRVYLCLMTLATVNKATFIFLQSMGKPWASTLLSMVREVVFGVGFALLLPRVFGLSGVLYSMPVSDALTFVISAVLIVRTWRELKKPDSSQSVPA